MMSDQRPLQSTFSEIDDPALTYKPISAMAVVSLLVGIAALGAFFSWVLWIVPPIAIIIAGLTSRRLDQARDEYAGQFIAKLGLLCAVIGLAGAPTIYFTKRFILGRESRAVADSFIDLILEHKLKNAFAYTVRPDMQQAAAGDADKILDRAGKERYQGFLGQPPIGLFGGRGADAQVTHIRHSYEGSEKGVERVVHNYIIAMYNDKGEANEYYKVFVLVSGGVSPDWTGRRWFIEMIQAEPYDPEKNAWKPASKS